MLFLALFHYWNEFHKSLYLNDNERKISRYFSAHADLSSSGHGFPFFLHVAIRVILD